MPPSPFNTIASPHTRNRLGIPDPLVIRQTARRAGPPRGAESPLTNILPPFIVEPAYFHQIPVAAGMAVPANQQGWFGLRSIRVDEDTGGELTFFGAEIQMLPCDVAGSGVTPAPSDAPIAWGDARGLTAAVVVGMDLGVTEGAWSFRPAHIPGIEAGSVQPVQSLRSTRGAPGYSMVQHFPSGQWSDTTPSKVTVIRSRVPYVQRVTIGHTLDVAFVCRRSYVNNLGAAGTIVGFADVRLLTGRTTASSQFTQ